MAAAMDTQNTSSAVQAFSTSYSLWIKGGLDDDNRTHTNSQTVSTKNCLRADSGSGHTHSTSRVSSKAIGMPMQNRKYEAWIQWISKFYMEVVIIIISTAMNNTYIGDAAVLGTGSADGDNWVASVWLGLEEKASEAFELETRCEASGPQKKEQASEYD